MFARIFFINLRISCQKMLAALCIHYDSALCLDNNVKLIASSYNHHVDHVQVVVVISNY